MKQVCGLVMVLAVLVLAARHGVESECQDWSPAKESKNVCCYKCAPGNRLSSDCGPDQNALCTPCKNNTYILDTSEKKCLRCTQCTGLLRVKVSCSPSSDTVCECSQGFRCGDDKCVFCVKECVAGQQPVNRKCESCPPGTYNNQIHQPCIPWSKCTQPDQIIVPGTAKSDVICGPKRKPEQTTSPPNRPTLSPPSSIDNTVAGVLLAFGLLCIVLFAVPFLYLEWRKKKIKTPAKKDALTAVQTETAFPEECSFCFPQQEHGGGSSLTSMSSLVSEDKAMPLQA